MRFFLIYLLIGLILTGLVDYATRKNKTTRLTPLMVVISILAWPILLGFRIFSKS